MGNYALLSTATTLTLTLLFLVSLSPARTTGEVVRDREGNPLEVGSEYFIQAVGPGLVGPRIGRAPKPDQEIPCPLYATESPEDKDLGRPVKFTPAHETQTQIHLNSKVQIDSGFSAYCRDNGLWRVGPELDPTYQRFLVIATGVFDVPRAWFKIQLVAIPHPLRYAYKITLAGGDHDVAVFKDPHSGLKLLGLTKDSDDQPIYVVFIKNSNSYSVASSE